jgi:hypothetical protein
MSMRYNYSIIDGEIVIIDKHGQKIHWRGRPKGIEVMSIFPISSSEDCIVLLNWRKISSYKEKNLLRIRPDGHVAWEVSDPSPNVQLYGVDRDQDFYVRILEIDSSFVQANSYLGFVDYIDMENGQVRDSVFVK